MKYLEVKFGMARGEEMKAVCIFDNGLKFFLTEGRLYDVRESKFNINQYLLVDDTGRTNAHNKRCFQLIQDEEASLFELYFIQGESEFIYGKGSKEYIIELLQDYIVTHEMYNLTEIGFKIVKNVNFNNSVYECLEVKK